jgi:hypothetical protein
MTKPPRSAGSNFSKREIVLFVLVMILATALTVWGTFYLLLGVGIGLFGVLIVLTARYVAVVLAG